MTVEPIRKITWTGGVTSLRGFSHGGKPMRVAGWITGSGHVLKAAIVESKAPSVLRQLFDELMKSEPPQKLPTQLVVWPVARAAFRDVVYPPVIVKKDMFFKVVIEDQGDFGRFPGELPVRRG